MSKSDSLAAAETAIVAVFDGMVEGDQVTQGHLDCITALRNALLMPEDEPAAPRGPVDT